MDPDGRINFDTVVKGVDNIITGIGKMTSGSAIFTASGAGELVSCGVATPIAVVGLLLGGGLVTNGFVQTSVGVAEVVAGFTDCTSEEDKCKDIPNTLNSSFCCSVDILISSLSGENFTKGNEIATWIDKNIPPTTSVKENVQNLIVTPIPLYEKSPSYTVNNYNGNGELYE